MTAIRYSNHMASETITVALPETLEEFVRERARSGHFQTPGDYLTALIRDDQQRQAAEVTLADLEAEFRKTHGDCSEEDVARLRAEYWRRWRELRAEIAEAIESVERGEVFDADDEFLSDIKRRGRQRLADLQNQG